MMKSLLLIISSLFFASAAFAAPYKVDYAMSLLKFSGINADNAFSGVFENWEAQIEFDPNQLDKSKVSVTIETASAKTGNSMYDGTLPSVDWFDVKNFPKATFVSNEISKNADGTYQAKGTLTIRNISLPIEFSFRLSPAELSSVGLTATAMFVINRIAYGIGVKSDAKAEWVSRDIGFEFTVVAERKP